jgi:hypothetical protein
MSSIVSFLCSLAARTSPAAPAPCLTGDDQIPVAVIVTQQERLQAAAALAPHSTEFGPTRGEAHSGVKTSQRRASYTM